MFKEMKTVTKIVLIIVIALVITGIAALDAFTEFDATEYISELISGVVGLIVGLVSRKAPAAPAAALALLLIPAATGCGGYTPPDNACEIEGTVVASLSAGLDAAEGVVGDRGGEDWQDALSGARFASRLGSLAIDGCHLARDGSDWRRWVTDIALPAVGIVTSFIDTMAGGEHLEVPPELVAARERLEAEIER